MNHTRTRRRLFPVISSLQYRFLAMTLVYSFLIVCFFAVVTFLPDMMDMRDPGLSLEARSNAASRVLAKHTWVWPAVLSLIIVLALHSFRAFLKVIGPLYRFRWAFEQLGNGNMLFRIKLRKRDYLRTEEEALNNMLETLNGRLESVKEATEEAFKSIDELEQSATKGNEWSKPQIDMLRAHREHLQRLVTEVQFFRSGNKNQVPSSSERDA
ncbi:MAG: methyl-accepting chemotaxis protein [Desulfobacteraceae bacterium]|nr:methyl-accepting chemotaxis protein [Desulfobacteraceae bacterium]